MAEDIETPEPVKKKPAKGMIVIGLLLSILGGGGGFYAAYSGMILSTPVEIVEEKASITPEERTDIAFIALDPIIVNLAASSNSRYLKFGAQLEVPTVYLEEVKLLSPRVVDMLNSYLRALEVEDIESPYALLKLRAQILRRIDYLAGEGRVNDFLIMEYTLS